MTDELNFMTARDLARRVRDRELSAVEVLQAHLEQIDRVNPIVNAIVTAGSSWPGAVSVGIPRPLSWTRTAPSSSSVTTILSQ